MISNKVGEFRNGKVSFFLYLLEGSFVILVGVVVIAEFHSDEFFNEVVEVYNYFRFALCVGFPPREIGMIVKDVINHG